MKVNRIVIGILALAISWLVYCQLTPNKTAFVISDNLVSEYQGMKDAKDAFRQKQRIWQTNLDSLQSQYQRALKSDQDKAQVYLHNVNKYRTQIKGKAEQEDQKMTQTVLDQINTFTELYGEKYGYDLILGTTAQGNVLYGKTSLDITDHLLQELNRYYATGDY